MGLSDSIYTAAMEAMEDGLLIVDQRHNVVFANQRFIHLFGDFKAGQRLDLVYPDFAREIGPYLHDALRGKKPAYIDFKIVEDMAERQLTIRLSGIKVTQGSKWQCLVQVSDLTESATRDQELYSRLAEMNRQLSTAQRYQQALFTSHYRDETASVNAFGEPVIELSGDFFNFSRNNGQFLFVLGDVQSHGIDVAMKAICLQQLCHILLESEKNPAAVLQRLNAFVCNDQHDKFWTSCLFVGIYDIGSGRCRYARAGIPEPVLVKLDGSITTLPRGDMPLGYFEEEVYEMDEVTIDPGDRLLMFSDGVTESTRNGSGDIIGLQGLIAAYRELVVGAKGHLLDRILAKLAEIHGNTNFTDDVTMAEIIFDRR